MKGERSTGGQNSRGLGFDDTPWDDITERTTARQRITIGSLLAAVALTGLCGGLAACQQNGLHDFNDTGPRITGDPAVSARVEQIPEGTAPFDAPITELGVTTNDSLPTPIETTCEGGGQDVVLTLKSGRQLRYPFCAMPDEIVAIRDAAWTHDADTVDTNVATG